MNPDLANLLGAIRDQPGDEIAYLALADWCLEQSRAGRSVWCYFNNDIHGHAIHDAQTLKSMVSQMIR